MNPVKLTERTGYFEGPVTVGYCHLSPEKVLLIDSGSDDSAARKIAARLEQEGITIGAILNTHSHADHCGGNRHLQKRTGCRVFARGIEAALIRDPILEPMYLYGGGPLKALQNKFLQAEATEQVERLESETLILEGSEFQLIDLSGHSPAMVGVRTPDDVVFLGDGLIGLETARKHQILYHFNLGGVFRSLERIEGLTAEHFVLSHGGLCQDLSQVVADNRERLLEVNRRILTLAEEPIGREALLEKLLNAYGMKPPLALYYLNLGLLSSHLDWLERQGQVRIDFDDGMPRYRTVTTE